MLAFDGEVGGVMGVVFFVQAQKEDAAGFEIAGDVVDDIADVDIAVGVDGAVDYVFVGGLVWHGLGKYIVPSGKIIRDYVKFIDIIELQNTLISCSSQYVVI